MDSKHSEASVPFADPPWLNGIPSPYYTDSHRRWQKTCRSFIEPYFGQHGLAWEKAGHAPPDLFLKFAQAGFIVPNLPAPLPVKELQSAGIHELPGGLKLEEFDYLHYAIYTTEVRHFRGLNSLTRYVDISLRTVGSSFCDHSWDRLWSASHSQFWK